MHAAAKRGAARRPGRPSTADRLETRRDLLAVARDHFADHGYADATLKNIADDVGVTTGSIYHYFRTKAELFTAVADDSLATVLEALHAGDDDRDPVVERLRSALRISAYLNARHPGLVGFMWVLDTEGPRHPELRETRGRVMGARGAFFERLVSDAADRGELQPGVAPGSVVDLVEALRMGISRFSLHTGSARRQRQVIAGLEALLAGSLFDDRPAAREGHQVASAPPPNGTRPRRPAGRPAGADSAETRRRLLAVARDHVAERGYSGATLKEIAVAAGVTAAAVYHYFPSKHELVVAVVESCVGLWTREVRDVVPADGGLVERLRAAFDATATLQQRCPSLASLTLVLDLEAARHPELRAVVDGYARARDGFFAQLVADAVRRGQLGAGRAEATVDLLATIRMGMSRFAHHHQDNGRHRAMATALTALFGGDLLARNAG